MANRPGSINSGGQMKFPTNTPGRARNAMARLNEAKPKLTAEEKKIIANAVERELGKSTPATSKILGRKKKQHGST